ncbi:ESCRT-II complex, vps25 subunit [Wallemia mellicola]|uniref:ESCRT-II complex, vps25 subunit n=1 Tax=Wallemia mellicola TaxID=1708541 RepID=A0A4T0M4Z9_9BASI|nr:hypothetical protein E3Q23_01172 [Wallemia mellicola]TIB81043.1 ESCRT-II complex, vps25 subunit [Wallemia mellicola]TIC13225.1 ESCRT-II complex, vps25 subunit [Wallemia mellicola]TIC14838.1 ESCRT-II complex, vps25 subunit [Wallemia mellicola]TIC58387.1 ESCRT-II complex, vps25 subunit [Wallemia mellicola]
MTTIIDFPPFYTQQPNVETLSQQLQLWLQHILKVCKQRRQFQLSMSDDIWTNEKIQRAANREFITVILDSLVKNGLATYTDTTKESVWVYWRTLAEWAAVLYDHVDGTAQLNTPLTYYELTEGDYSHLSELNGLPTPILRSAINILVKQNKAVTIKTSNGEGVKFI